MSKQMTINPKRTVNVAVQVVPLHDDAYPLIDRAIQTIDESGVIYEVGPMETVMEGELDQLLEVAKAAHLACLEAGAQKVVTFIKIGDDQQGTSMQAKVGKYRSIRGQQ
jgi:uncharacterized protein (TIGR00106 family)